MRWDDERYVRLYSPRNDGDWDMWPWQARALFPLMLRKADRIGVIKCGKHGVRALAHMVAMPPEHVEVGLAALLEDGCVQEVRQNILLIRNYLVAQETAQNDRARKAAQRERERDLLSAEAEGLIAGVTHRDNESQNVTSGHDSGGIVTAGHVESHPVTPGRADPGRAQDLAAGAASAGAAAQEADPPARQAARVRKPRKPKAAPPAQVSLDAALETVPVDEIIALLATTSGGRFVAPSEVSKERRIALAGYLKGKTRRQVRVMGEYLAAGGLRWKGALTIGSIAKKDDFVELLDLARAWDEGGRPDPQPAAPRPAFARPDPPRPAPPEFTPAAMPQGADDPEERRRLREEEQAAARGAA